MLAYPLYFLFGFVVAFVPSVAVFANTQSSSSEKPIPSEQVLAISTDMPYTPLPSSTPTVVATAAPSAPAATTATTRPTSTPTPTPSVDPTPTPEPTVVPIPTATPDVWSPAELEPFFDRYAGEYGVDKNVLERIAVCESHFNPSAISSNGLYAGMFQFASGTWQGYRARMGLDPNLELRHNAEESIKTAAYVVASSGTHHWSRCLR